MLYSIHFFYLEKFLYVLKRPVIATQPFGRNCFATATEGFKQFEYRTTDYFNINVSESAIASFLEQPVHDIFTCKVSSF